jgi:hypothetical protein
MVSLQREYDLERSTYSDPSGKKQTALLDEEPQRKQAAAVRGPDSGRPAVRTVRRSRCA